MLRLPQPGEKLTLPPPPRLFHPNLMPFIGSNCDNAFAEENKKKTKMRDIAVQDDTWRRFIGKVFVCLAGLEESSINKDGGVRRCLQSPMHIDEQGFII